MSGRRFCLLWCLLLTASGYVTLAIASTLTFVMLARILNGLFKHSQSLTKSLLADITSKEEQSAVLGTFNAASSLGFIVGPLIGGHVAETSNGFQKVGLLSAFVFIANSVLIYMCVEDHKKTSSEDDKLKPDFPKKTTTKGIIKGLKKNTLTK
ncbi:major 9 facilitator superfamily domain-containing protein, partial [Mytilus galloprovincialis]